MTLDKSSLKYYFQQYLDSDGQFYSYLSHVIDTFYHPKLYQVHLSRDRNQTHNISGDKTHFHGKCKYNYYAHSDIKSSIKWEIALAII